MTGLALSVSQALRAITASGEEQALLPLQCYWVVAEGDREAYVSAIEAEAGSLPVVAVVVREEAFDDPNGISQDVASVIARGQAHILGERSDILRNAGRAQVVLVARRELRVASTASAIRLPEWFPVCPGESTYVGVTDLTWRADEPLSSQMLQMDALRALLFRIERALVRGIGSTLKRNASLAASLRERLFPGEEGQPLADCLARATQAAQTVTNPAHFRPAAGRSPEFLVAWLFRMVNNCTFDGTHSTATALAAALQLKCNDQLPAYEPLSCLLLRSSQPDATPDPSVRFCRGLLLGIRATLVLSNGAAHADAYGHYSVNLLRALSLDLRRGLREAAEVLEAQAQMAESRDSLTGGTAKP